MTTQPEALRLADWLEDQYDPTHNQAQAAAELRRLYAERTAADGVVNDLAAKVRGLQTHNDALLEALKKVLAEGDFTDYPNTTQFYAVQAAQVLVRELGSV